MNVMQRLMARKIHTQQSIFYMKNFKKLSEKLFHLLNV